MYGQPSDERLAGPLRIAVVGTWGVPARYGGFETLAEQLARSLTPDIAEISFYGQKSAYSELERAGPFAGHARVWLPFSANGFQSVLHDALQLLHASWVGRHDRILLLGTSGAWALPLVRLNGLLRGRRIRIVANIDGLEWRRDKFGPLARGLLKLLEWFAVRFSSSIVADNAALVPMVRDLHGVEPLLIAYGGDHIGLPANAAAPASDSFLAIARIEPENNSALILEAAADTQARILFVGNWSATRYGCDLLATYGINPRLTLHPAVYDQSVLADLRGQAEAYVHGHSVGGTNPSLVEAIFHCERILAFDCPFNRATLEGEGAYFGSAAELARLMREPGSGRIAPAALARLRHRYRWETIAASYLAVMADPVAESQPAMNFR